MGVKTIADSAEEYDDFEPIDVILTIPPLSQKSVVVNIKDDEGWEPDEDFFVILYDPNDEDKKQLYGDNTRTKVTILDDDKPGTFQMKMNHVQVKRSEGVAKITINRIDGADGEAQVGISSQSINNCPNPAREDFDYVPFAKDVHFGPGVSEKVFEITIPDERTNGPEEEEESKVFMVVLSNPHPAGCKLSKRNIC